MSAETVEVRGAHARAQQRLPGPRTRVAIAAAIAVALVAVFLTIEVYGYWNYILPMRIRKVTAMILVACAIATSTVLFQTITNNRILTPSLMGFDALYVALNTGLAFAFGVHGIATLDVRVRFALQAVIMVGFALLLFRWIFGGARHSLHLLVLVGLIFGTMFRSIAALLQRLIEPSEFLVLQDLFFASFNAVDENLLIISAVLIGGIGVIAARMVRLFDVLGLGRETSVGLGVDYRRAVTRILVMIAILVAVSTALVGPITFFGLLVANLAYLVAGSSRHAVVIPMSIMLSIITLVGGQLVLERVFEFDTSLSVIIEFLGGIVFILLLVSSSRGVRR